MRQDGYLLMETLIVLALTVCLCMLGLRSFTWSNHALVRLDLDAVYLLILACSQRAVCTGLPYQMVCSLDGSITGAGLRYHLTDGVCFGAVSGAMGPPSAPTVAIDNPITFVDHQIICYPDGTMSSGTLYLTNSEKVCSYAVSCSIGAMTYARRYRYKKNYNRWALLT